MSVLLRLTGSVNRRRGEADRGAHDSKRTVSYDRDTASRNWHGDTLSTIDGRALWDTCGSPDPSIGAHLGLRAIDNRARCSVFAVARAPAPMGQSKPRRSWRPSPFSMWS